MKQGIHPDYQIANVHCSCGNTFQTRSTVSEIRAEHLLELPSVLHGQAEARGHRRPRRAVPAPVREDAGSAAGAPSRRSRRVSAADADRTRPHLYGGQAVIEGVMMRGADHWAVAVRRPAGDIHVESHEIDSVASGTRSWRKPFLRGIIVLGPVARDRHARAAGRGEPVVGGGGAAHVAAGGHLARARDRLVRRDLHRSGRRCCSRGSSDTRRAARRSSTCSRACSASALFVGYLWLIGTDEGHPPGVRVPRRRAQDDRRLRARRPARPRARRSRTPRCTFAAARTS